ncbi:porin family protein [Sediminibacterium roseum]|uniref:Porin family protein n=1 Tax=Sediminibacterium roseum TaxID=1978412 RepID=A0ABW9ZRU4_9BACT|nr:outer membrane beta-barrel protein [Sediminibacterium roseum]NCI49818.1 porin family protein [Sediminibacterium roseum]
MKATKAPDLSNSRFTHFFVFSLFFFTIPSTINAQLGKGNWLIGGNASFSNTSYTGSSVPNYNQSYLQISPAAGLFLGEKLAVGLRPGYSHVYTNTGSSKTSADIFNIGPFLRYYFLEAANRTNIFAEVGYLFESSKELGNPSSNSSGFNIMAGPVVFLNPNVGIEFTVGYKRMAYTGGGNMASNVVQVGAGIQVYLERSKSL